MQKTLLMLGGILCILSCNNTSKPDHKLESANWLLGEWKNASANGVYTETWKQENDSLFTGESYYIIEKDTPSAEAVRLEQHGADLFYIPTVRDQNNNQPVSFKLTSSSDKELVFENPEHDFPQKIVYTRINTDSLLASIMGPREGKMDTIYFPLKRTE